MTRRFIKNVFSVALVFSMFGQCLPVYANEEEVFEEETIIEEEQVEEVVEETTEEIAEEIVEETGVEEETVEETTEEKEVVEEEIVEQKGDVSGGSSFSTAYTLKVGTLSSVSVTGSQSYFKFVPQFTGSYTFESTGSCDTVGYLYNSSQSQLTSNDDYNGSSNFSITYTLTKGQTYYLGVRLYSSGSNVTSIKISGPTSATGTCGSLTWMVDSTGSLTIVGNGAIPNGGSISSFGWGIYKDDIKYIFLSTGVTQIGDHAFDRCSNLILCDVLSSCTRIGANTFSNCTSLEEVTLHDGLKSIDDYAFSNCSSLTELYIPESVTTINGTPFVQDSNLVISSPLAKKASGWSDHFNYYDDTHPLTVVYLGAKDPSYTFAEMDNGISCFDEYGNALTGFVVVDGSIPCNVDNGTYYFDNNGLLQYGWQTIDGNKYYFDLDTGCMFTGSHTIDGVSCIFGDDGILVESINGWQVIDGNTYYYENLEKVTDWKKIDGSWYYFGQEGIMADGWLFVNGNTYYLDNGIMTTNWKQLDDNWYYFGSNGRMVKGWQQVGSSWYWFDSEGIMIKGSKVINGSSYFFDDHGIMVKGWKQLDDSWYWFDDHGVMITGWKQINNYWYWFDSEGVMQTGHQRINGNKYIFASNGVMQTGWIKEHKYYYDEEWDYETEWDDWYYANPNGTLVHGWFQINNYWYFFDREDAWMYTDNMQIDGSYYYFYENGILHQNGWVESNWGIWFYAESNGKLVTGWKQFNNQWYWFDQEGWMSTGFRWINGKRYYFNDRGVMLTGWQYVYDYWWDKYAQEYDDFYAWCYANPDGTIATGWKQINGSWYWFTVDGQMWTDWLNLDGNRYYFRSDGTMVTGWYIMGGKSYYFDSNGHMANGWKQISGKWYFFDGGAMAKNVRLVIDGKCYRFYSDGSYYLENNTGYYRVIKPTDVRTGPDYSYMYVNTYGYNYEYTRITYMYADSNGNLWGKMDNGYYICMRSSYGTDYVSYQYS